MIHNQLKRGILPNGYELQPWDVGKPLALGFGVVTKNDVGKRVYVKSYGFAMENDEQRDKRKGKA